MKRGIKNRIVTACLLAAIFVVPCSFQWEAELHNHSLIDSNDNANCPICQFTHSSFVEAEQCELIPVFLPVFSEVFVYQQDIYKTIFISLYLRGPPARK
jgi:hypothetical protein